MQRLKKLEFRIKRSEMDTLIELARGSTKRSLPFAIFSGYLTKSQQFATIVPHVKPAGSTSDGAFSCIDTNELM